MGRFKNCSIVATTSLSIGAISTVSKQSSIRLGLLLDTSGSASARTASCVSPVKLKNLAYQTGQTVYQLEVELLSNYLIDQLKRPALPMSLVKLRKRDCATAQPSDRYPSCVSLVLYVPPAPLAKFPNTLVLALCAYGNKLITLAQQANQRLPRQPTRQPRITIFF